MKQFPEVLYVVRSDEDEGSDPELMCDPDISRLALVEQEVRVAKYMLLEEGTVYTSVRYQRGVHK